MKKDDVYEAYKHFVYFCYWHSMTSYRSCPLFSRGDDIVEMYGLKFPHVEAEEQWVFWEEFADIVLPFVLELSGHKYDFEMISALLDEGPYELNENVCVEKGDLVVDCGTNIGLFSAIAAYKGARTLSFEPSKITRQKYTEKTALLNPGINVCPFALGKEKGKAFFDNSSSIASSRLSADDENCGETVDVITLDEYVESCGIQKVDFIKADIEGAERYMLSGAKRILGEMQPKLSICTYHLRDDKEVLEKIVKEANSRYVVEHRYKKMYAYVPQ